MNKWSFLLFVIMLTATGCSAKIEIPPQGHSPTPTRERPLAIIVDMSLEQPEYLLSSGEVATSSHDAASIIRTYREKFKKVKTITLSLPKVAGSDRCASFVADQKHIKKCWPVSRSPRQTQARIPASIHIRATLETTNTNQCFSSRAETIHLQATDMKESKTLSSVQLGYWNNDDKQCYALSSGTSCIVRCETTKDETRNALGELIEHTMVALSKNNQGSIANASSAIINPDIINATIAHKPRQ